MHVLCRIYVHRYRSIMYDIHLQYLCQTKVTELHIAYKAPVLHISIAYTTHIQCNVIWRVGNFTCVMLVWAILCGACAL